MTPSRFRQIENIYNEARDRTPNERAAYLEKACAGDEPLRCEVESLLAQDSSRINVLDRPAWKVEADALSGASTVTVLAAGMQLGPYKVEGPLGKGGMGEVFRAIDTRLGRAVAIKISNEQYSDRFEREARAISALNHPHICTLYDVGAIPSGASYLVMELIEGESLATRLKRGKLSISDTLKYGQQIADALAAAHAKGIVHRDLKPHNVMVSKMGVKVLDFGLARAPHDDTLTVSRAAMGTPAYMAPELFKGQAADTRSDIYALGLVLYEMGTGKRPPQGEIPEMGALPPQFARIVERCLARDPDDRWQSARDVTFALEWSVIPGLPASRRTAMPWVLGVGAFVVGAALVLYFAPRESKATGMSSFRLDVNEPQGAEFRPGSGIAISPDGRTLAFIGRSADGDKLWFRPLNSSTAREVPGTVGATFPFWAPNSKSLAYFSSGKLWRIDVSGGSPRAICDVASGRGGAWGRDGTILFNGVNDGPLLRVSADGGTPMPATSLDTQKHENSHRWPQFLPDGRHILYYSRGGDSGVYEISLDQPQDKTRVLVSNSNAVFAPEPGGKSGHILWATDEGTLMAQAFNPRNGELGGDASALAEGISLGTDTRLAAVSVSNTGVLVLGTTASEKKQLEWRDRNGKALGTLGQPESYYNLRISPDGKRVALGGIRDIWQIEFARNVATRVTASGSSDLAWSPDSGRIAHNGIGAPPNISVTNLDSTATAERLTNSRDSQTPLDWSPDGQFLLYGAQTNDLDSKAQRDLWLLPIKGGQGPVQFTKTPFWETRGRFSPDGKWIAYTSDESGRNEVYVRSFPLDANKWQVSSEGGDYPIWRRDGKELFYVTLARKLQAVTVSSMARGLAFGAPRSLFEIEAVSPSPGTFTYTFDIMPDGQRFLFLAPTASAAAPTISVVTNWQGEISVRKN